MTTPRDPIRCHACARTFERSEMVHGTLGLLECRKCRDEDERRLKPRIRKSSGEPDR